MQHNLPKLDLNITNRCNYKCQHCAFDSGIKKMEELTLEELTLILEQTKKLGGTKIDITGGEPTTRKDFEKLVKIASDMDYKIELVTNGSLLTKEILIRLRDLGLHNIAVSIDGATYGVHQKIRQCTSLQYERSLQSIKDALGIGLPSKINTLVCEQNLEDIPKIIELGIENKVMEVGIYYFTPVGRGQRTNIHAVEPLKWLEFIREKLHNYKDGMKVSLEIPMIEKERYRKGMGCIVGEDHYHLQILPDGNVYPCAIMASYDLPAGNLRISSVEELWRNEKIWKNYWNKIESILEKNDGHCVNFSEFDMRKYKGYAPVCPLRKYTIGDLL